MKINEKIEKEFLSFQKNEITESEVYRRLANVEKIDSNKKILVQIAKDEMSHYELFKTYTNKDVKADMIKVWFNYIIARLFGLTFAVKQMENNEINGKNNYESYNAFPEIKKIAEDEEAHEQMLINMINEERLAYMGSVVLGLNDALVEFTGALAGFTLALNDSKLIALTGSITGIAAALSMASSEYLSTKSDDNKTKYPVKAAVYTGIAYLITVTCLVAPFIIFSNVLFALALMLVMALIIIAIFNYYYAVAKSESFKSRFLEMGVLSFSVAGVSFLIGYLLKLFTGIEA
ncbi:MAG: VIT1/CCC1 transporter family protein [Bacteroidales bacterium]|nr:VIT1/CCC1 transporter family protein [Bacteroidales bacterium]